MAPKKCGVCDESVGKKNSIQCDVCSIWVHQSCTVLSDQELDVIGKHTFLKFVCADCESNNGLSKQVGDDISALNKKFDDMVSKAQEETTSVKNALAEAVVQIKSEMNSILSEMRSEVADCNKHIHSVDDKLSGKILALQIENHVLYKRMNRTNIIIRGLPPGLPDLVAAVVALGAFFNIPVAGHDINHVCYINNKRLILVVFNSVLLRDNIMREYFKTRTLRRSNIIDEILSTNDEPAGADPNVGGKITDRVYLNDHFSPAASKLNASCRKLLHDKVILKYKLYNNDKLRADLTLPSGKMVEVRDVVGCSKLRDGDYVIN